MLTDAEAMAEIYKIIDGTEWSADTVQDICDIVVHTGRVVHDLV